MVLTFSCSAHCRNWNEVQFYPIFGPYSCFSNLVADISHYINSIWVVLSSIVLCWFCHLQLISSFLAFLEDAFYHVRFSKFPVISYSCVIILYYIRFLVFSLLSVMKFNIASCFPLVPMFSIAVNSFCLPFVSFVVWVIVLALLRCLKRSLVSFLLACFWTLPSFSVPLFYCRHFAFYSWHAAEFFSIFACMCFCLLVLFFYLLFESYWV